MQRTHSDRTADMTHLIRSFGSILLAIVLGLSACSSGDTSGSDTSGSDTNGGTDPSVADSDSPDSDGAEAGAVNEPAESPAPTIPDVEPILTGVTKIPTLSPVVVDQLRPTLEWEPVAGAAEYSVVVLDEFGDPYWVWIGAESQVPIGGAESSDFGIGPIIGVDYSWSVVAFGTDRTILAASGQLPISVE